MAPDVTGEVWRRLLGVAALLVVAVATWNPPAPVPVADLGPADATGPRVAHPWQPGHPQLGIHVYWEDNPLDDDAAVERKARRLVDQVVGLEANSLAISFPFFTDSITSSTVGTDARTPSPARIAILLEQARASGLRTTLRPLLDQTNLLTVDELNWRGRLDPASRSTWFTYYFEFLVPYLRTAQATGVDTMIVGAELSGLQDDPRWAWIVERSREHYTGELGYSANWDAYPSAVAGVPVDAVGIDAYPYLPGLVPWSTEDEMTVAWQTWLDVTSGGAPGTLVLSEVGGAAEPGVVYNPAAHHTVGAPLDERVQRRWFAAACRAARAAGVAGFYWWKLDLHVDPALADPDTDLHDTFLGRPAEHTVRDCFTRWEQP
ncbi:MAG: glycoside hydrolase family 113 [Pseudonocardia sp.]